MLVSISRQISRVSLRTYHQRAYSSTVSLSMRKQDLISTFGDKSLNQSLVKSTDPKFAANLPSTSSSSSSKPAAMTAPKEGQNAAAGAPKKEKKEKKKMIDLAPPSGTRDFFPDEMKQEQW